MHEPQVTNSELVATSNGVKACHKSQYAFMLMQDALQLVKPDICEPASRCMLAFADISLSATLPEAWLVAQETLGHTRS